MPQVDTPSKTESMPPNTAKRTTPSGSSPEETPRRTRSSSSISSQEFGLLELNISVKDLGHDKSNVYVTYISTGLTEAGNREVAERFTDAEFNQRMAEWEHAMNYFLETGKMLKEHK